VTALLKPSHTTAQLPLQTSEVPQTVLKETGGEIQPYIALVIALLVLSLWPQQSSAGRAASPAACLGMAAVTAGTGGPLPHHCLQAVASPPYDQLKRGARFQDRQQGHGLFAPIPLRRQWGTPHTSPPGLLARSRIREHTEGLH